MPHLWLIHAQDQSLTKMDSSTPQTLSMQRLAPLCHRFTGVSGTLEGRIGQHAKATKLPLRSGQKVQNIQNDMPDVHIELLKDFAISVKGEAPPYVVTSRAQCLITFLLLQPQGPIHRARIAEQLWPESYDGQSRTNLRNLIHQIRSKFPALYDCLSLEGKTIRWRSESSYSTDLEELEAILSEKANSVSVQRATELYRGDLMPHIDEHWLVKFRSSLRTRYCNFLADGTTVLEESRAYHEAIDVAKVLQRFDPLREETYRRLMRLYALTGERSNALNTYRDCAKVLQSELSITPSKSTIKVKNSIQYSSATTASPDAHRQITLVGRNTEWNSLVNAWQKSEHGNAAVSLIQGEAGIGKSCLAEALLQWAEAQGINCIRLKCYQPSNQMTYRSLVDLVRSCPTDLLDESSQGELALLLPEFGQGNNTKANLEGPNRQRLMEAISKATLTKQRLIIIVDRAEWCDEPTATWLNFHLRYAASAQHHIVITARDGRLNSQHPLRGLINNARQQGRLTHLQLNRLSRKDSDTLAESSCRGILDAYQLSKLHELCNGLPLSIVEVVKAGFDDMLEGERPVIPQSLQGLYQELWDELSEASHTLLQILAVAGRPQSWDALIRASDLDERGCLNAIEPLITGHLIIESEQEEYYLGQVLLGTWINQNQLSIRLRLLKRKLQDIDEALNNVRQNIDISHSTFRQNGKNNHNTETQQKRHLLLP